MSKSKVRTVLIVFFDIRGLVHHKFVPLGTTINARFYVEMLKRLKWRAHNIRTDIAGDWKHHHDSAPAHTAFALTCFLVDSKVSRVPQLPYTPDLAPPDFFFVSALENFHEGTSFRHSWQSQRSLHQGSKGHSGGNLLWHLRCLEMSLEGMYRQRRSLSWILLMGCTDLINKSFLIDSLTLLFGHTLYILEKKTFSLMTPICLDILVLCTVKRHL